MGYVCHHSSAIVLIYFNSEHSTLFSGQQQTQHKVGPLGAGSLFSAEGDRSSSTLSSKSKPQPASGAAVRGSAASSSPHPPPSSPSPHLSHPASAATPGLNGTVNGGMKRPREDGEDEDIETQQRNDGGFPCLFGGWR